MKGSKISSKKDACSPTKQEALKIRNKLGDVKDKVVIIYISGHGSDRQEFLQTVQNRIEAGPQASRRFVETQIFDFQSLGELIRETGNDASPLMRAALDTQFTVAIGIIDTKGITKIKYKEIQAEIRRTGDRKIGAVTICIPKQSLQSFFNCGFDASFLANNCITRKIDAMQGLSNWRVEADQLQAAIGNKIDPCNSIIIGGHISHPDSVSTERSPSVAAIVASIDDKLALYPGSIRLQADRTDKDTCAISGLEKMLIERFMAWKEKHQNYSGEGPTVFYYRGAYNTRYSRAFSIEKDAIQKAHAVVFGKKDTDCVKLAYIIVSRNLHRHWSHLDREDVPFSFTTRDPEGRNTAKYQYNVMYNSTGRFRYELAQLVGYLSPRMPTKC